MLSSACTFLWNTSVGSLWFTHAKPLQVPPKGIYGQTLGEHLDCLDETMQCLPLQKSHSTQNNPYCLSLGCINTQIIKIICQKNPSQTTQGNIHVTKTWKLGNAFASFIIFLRAQERGEDVQCSPDDRDFHLVKQPPRYETTISGSWIAWWILDFKKINK